MAEVIWIKVTTHLFDDEKIKLIEAMPDADAILIIWFKLLIQAGKTNANGYIYLTESMPYTEEMLSSLFNRPLPTITLALNTLSNYGMIEISTDGIYINNWHKHQNIDGLDKIREQNRIRAQAYRERRRTGDAPSRDVTLPITLHHDAEVEVDIDLDTEIPKDKDAFTDDFIAFWDIYPRKDGKLAAYRKFKLAKKKHGIKKLMDAVASYSEACRGKEDNFIKLASTWMGQDQWYEEWIDRKASDVVRPVKPGEQSNYYKRLE